MAKLVVDATSLDVSITVLPVPDPNDLDDQLAVVDRMQDSIPPVANSIVYMSRQLF